MHRSAEENERRRLRESRTRAIGLMHSHPDDSTFSRLDVASFISDPEYKLSLVTAKGGAMRALVASKETHWLMSKNDTMLEVDQEVQMDLWFEKVKTNLQHILDQMDRATYTNYNTDPSFKNRIINDVFDKVFAWVAEQRKFGYYVGDEHGHMRRLRLKPKAKQ